MAGLKRLGTFASNLFTKHLFVTNTVVGTTLMASGDLIQQSIEIYQSDFKKKLDWSRTGSMALAGVALGAFGHGWYVVLERRLPGTKLSTIAKKLGLELAMGIPMGTGFILAVSLMEGLSFKKSVNEVKDKFPIMYLVECVGWPPIQFVNFYFLAPKYRVLYVSVVMLFWDIFMSYMIHKDRDEVELMPNDKTKDKSD